MVATQSFFKAEHDVSHGLTHSRRREIPELTGIRGVAALWVIAFHVDEISQSTGVGIGKGLLPVIGKGYLGVDLFFILSGFVLMLTYGRETITSRDGLRAFAIGRAFRVLPLHWSILLLYALIAPFMDGWMAPGGHNAGTFLIASTLLQTAFHLGQAWNAPAWSLSAEWMCYGLFPIMSLTLLRLRSPKLIVAGIAGSVALLIWAICARTSVPTLLITDRTAILRCAVEMLIGAATCHYLAQSDIIKKHGLLTFGAGAILLGAAMAGSFAEFIALPGFALLVTSCYTQVSPAKLVFSNKAVYFLGQISFPLYLVHWLLLEIFEALARSAGGTPSGFRLALLSVCALVVPVSWVLNRCVEVKGQAAGRTLVAYLRRRDVDRAAASIPSPRPGTPRSS